MYIVQHRNGKNVQYAQVGPHLSQSTLSRYLGTCPLYGIGKGKGEWCVRARKVHRVALISDYSVLSQTPAEAAKNTNTWPLRCAVCLSTSQLSPLYQIILLGDGGSGVLRSSIPAGSRTRVNVSASLPITPVNPF